MVYQNEHYVVRVGESLDYDGPATTRKLYQIQNKQTEVIEREDFALPYAIELADELSAALNRIPSQTIPVAGSTH